MVLYTLSGWNRNALTMARKQTPDLAADESIHFN